MWDKIKQFKMIITIVMSIVTATGIFTAYMSTLAKASDLESHVQEFENYKEYQRLDYIDRRIAQLEDRHRCFNDKCRDKMPVSVWEEYRAKRVEKLRLEKVLVK